MNSVGESSRSNERSATPVAPATAPGAPSLAVVAAGNASVNLSWNAPSSNGGSRDHRLQGLPRHRRRRRDAADDARRRSRPTSTRACSTGRPTTTRCSAINAGRRRPALERVVGDARRARDRSRHAGAELGDAGNASVALSWSAPSSDGGSAITGYKVYRGTSSGGESLLATLGTATGWTDTGAANGTTYWYQVSAINSVGESSRSSERSATPAAPATAPGTPTLNSATAGNGSVALAWSAPADGGSAITGYKRLPRHRERQREPARHARHRHQLDRHQRHQRHHLLLPGHRRQLRRRRLPLHRALRHPGRARHRARRADAQRGHRRQRQRRAHLERPGPTAARRSPATSVYRGTVERQRDACSRRSAPAPAGPTPASPTAPPTTTRSPPSTPSARAPAPTSAPRPRPRPRRRPARRR